MSDVPQNPDHAALWTRLIERKVAEPDELLTAADFEPLLKNFPGGVSDFPPAIFGIDLISAFPAAKIIITERDEDAWVDSISRTLVAGHRDLEQVRAQMEGGKYSGLDEDRYQLRKAYHTYCWKDDFANHGREYWRKYQSDIREAASKQRAADQVLIFNAKQGWEPLCKFLGKPVPSEPFPHVGSGESWTATATKEADENKPAK